MRRLFLFLIIGIFMISFASAFTFDNIKDERLITFDGKPILGDPLLEKYKPIEIRNALGLPIIGDKIFEGYISKHTEVCGSDCSSIMEINLHEKRPLVDDIYFETIRKDGSRIRQDIKSYQFYIQIGTSVEIVDDYGTECIQGKWNIVNNSFSEICSNVKLGSHQVTIPIWEKYNVGDSVEAGIYTLKLEGEKKKDRTVDWIIKTSGETLTEWAPWNASSNLLNSIVSYYKMDEQDTTGSGVIYDAHGWNNATNVGASNVTGKINTGYNFIAGETDRIILGNNASLAAINKNVNFSLSAWFKTSENRVDAVFVGADNGAAGGNKFHFSLITGGQIRFAVGTTVSLNGVGSGFNDGNWHNVVGVYNGTSYVYVDGVGVGIGTAGSDTPSVSTYIGDRAGGGNPFGGQLDEVAIWNRTLTLSEIVELNNSGAGLQYPFSNWSTITLGVPEDNYQTTGDVYFNATLNLESSTADNSTLWTNKTGTWAETNWTTGLSGTSVNVNWTTSFEDGVYLWTIQGCDSDGDCGFATENRTLTVDSTNPTISLESPTGTLDYGVLGGNETLNVTFTDANLDSCWYNYNGTNITIPGCVSGVKNSTSFVLTNKKNITIYANDTLSNIASSYYSWNYNLFENNQTYPTIALESSTKNYTANLNYDNSSVSIITGILNLNGSQFMGVKTGTGNNAIFTAQAIMPPVSEETNLTAYWTIGLTNDTGITSYNLTSHNVTVQEINLSLCGAGNTVPFWNFTVKNETNLVEINSTMAVTFTIKQTGSTTTNEFSYLDSSGNNSQYDFCITPSTDSYTVDASIKLTSPGFVDKFYNYENVILTNSTREDNLYMMLTGDSTSFIVHTVYVDSSDVEGAEVRVQRYYPGTGEWLTTEILTTNYIGEAVGHLLSEDADYRFLVLKDGLNIYNSSSTKITCTLAPCTVTLIIPIDVPTGVETVEDLDSSLTYSDTTNMFTYTYSDTSGDFDKARLYVYKIFPTNATIALICNSTKTDSSGVLTCDLTGQSNATYRADSFITRDSSEFLDKRLTVNIGTNIYNVMGLDGILWGFFVLIGIAMLGISRPSLAIIFGTVGLITLSILQIVNIGAISIIAISAVAIILLMRIGRE